MGPRTDFALLPTLYIYKYIMQERTPPPDHRGTLSSQNDPLRVLLSSDESESDSMTRTVSVVWV